MGVKREGHLRDAELRGVSLPTRVPEVDPDGIERLAARQSVLAPRLPHVSNLEAPLETRARLKREERERQAAEFEPIAQYEAMEKLRETRPDKYDGIPPGEKMALQGYLDRRAAHEEVTGPARVAGERLAEAEAQLDEARAERDRLKAAGVGAELQRRAQDRVDANRELLILRDRAAANEAA